MGETTTIDRKGRLLIPKKIRIAAGILPPAEAVMVVKGRGLIELVAVDKGMKKSKEIASKKLRGWREEDHEADKLAAEIVKEE